MAVYPTCPSGKSRHHLAVVPLHPAGDHLNPQDRTTTLRLFTAPCGSTRILTPFSLSLSRPHSRHLAEKLNKPCLVDHSETENRLRNTRTCRRFVSFLFDMFFGNFLLYILILSLLPPPLYPNPQYFCCKCMFFFHCKSLNANLDFDVFMGMLGEQLCLFV